MAEAEVTREELHHRRIDMRGFRRSDGLYEVEGRLTDRKPGEFMLARAGKVVPAGEPVHDMGVRLVYDEAMRVHAVETFTEASPYAMCSEGGRTLQSLVGLRMTSGWSKEVRSRLEKSQTCTHLKELLVPLATTAYQTLSFLNQVRPEKRDATGRPLKVDSCYAYGAGREVIMRLWPEYHRPNRPKE